MVYVPIVHSGTALIGPANENTKGKEEITLLPKPDFTQRATPRVMRYSESRSRKCCQTNDMIFSFLLEVEVEYILNFFRCANIVKGEGRDKGKMEFSRMNYAEPSPIFYKYSDKFDVSALDLQYLCRR